MKKFSDFNIEPLDEKRIFAVPVISIEELINCEIVVLDYETNITTIHGPNRYIVKIEHEGIEKKFFTNADSIKETLDKIDKKDFPFTTMIKARRFGGAKKTFYFT
ncbi:hypothetical protein SAMN05216364_1005108 [Porphyromonadaceae bacterium KHP3R9]|nr:hypothetical protein SAMN05216357_112110 [Porphyromonadaceae bacterium KH3CP3RA]SFU35564.1 hypothetical protein SAMN05216364_1005108 [Porphyromonadaceae bacterium KHP3R9]